MRSPFRYQMPGYSPVPLSSVARGVGALVRRGGAGAAEDDELVALLGRLYDARDVLLTGSGTQALQLAIDVALARVDTIALGIPAFCCYDMATAALAGDRQIALYDLDPATLAPDLDSLERLFRAGVRVVVVAPLYGVPLPWDEIEALALSYGALLIEDAAQGHGASWRGRPLGALGPLSVLSFGRGKGWTGGRGGALLARDPDIHLDFRLPTADPRDEAMNVCGTLAQWLLARPSLYGIPMSLPFLGLGETHLRQPSPPRAMECGARAILMRSRNASDAEAEWRRRRGAELIARLDGTRLEPIRVPREGIAGHHRLAARVRGGWHTVPDVRRARTLGLGASYPSTLAAIPDVRTRLRGPETEWPGATALVSELVTLPTHSRTRPDEIEMLLDLLAR